MRLHDWYHTYLYQKIYDDNEEQFNVKADPDMFVGETEIQAHLNQLIKQQGGDETFSENTSIYTQKTPQYVGLFAKSIKTLRELV